MTDVKWLSHDQFAHLVPLRPDDTQDVARVNHRRVISGIALVRRSGCRWKDALPVYGPHKTPYNRLVRLVDKGV